MSECCNHDCNQSDSCPRRCAVDLAPAVMGYLVVLLLACLAAAIWLVVLAE